jgi:hypothetical protein
MILLEVVVCLILGGASGAVVRAIPGVTTGWFLASGLVGLLGAILGTAVAHVAGLQRLLAVDIAGQRLPILWSISGAILLTIWVIAAQVLVSSHAPAHRRPS